MDINRTIIVVIILFISGFLYKRLQIKIDTRDKLDELDIIKRYFLNEQDDNYINKLHHIKLPILWVHIDYIKNSRKWSSFMERNSNEINQDYLYLTIRSIINNCGNDFHICLIDNQSFNKLLDNFNHNFKVLSEPSKSNIKSLGVLKLLEKYGGIYIENSFVVLKSLIPIYENIKLTNRPVTAEFVNRSLNSDDIEFCPNIKFYGCNKQCEITHNLITKLMIITSNDYTNQSVIENNFNNTIFKHVKNNEIDCIDGKYIGTRDVKNKTIDISTLCGSSYLELDNNCYCLYIPRDELLSRNTFNWICYLDSNQVLETKTNIAKYLLLSNNRLY